MDLLADHLRHRHVDRSDRRAPVFAMPGGGGVDYGHWRARVWKPAVARAGLRDVTFHDPRRANATALVADGVDLKTTRTRLGHSDPRLTLAVYAQATTEADRAAAERLADRLMRQDQGARPTDAP